MSARILVGDCRERMRELPDNSVDAVICDPPYEIGFMGRDWDRTGVAYDAELWREVLRVLKPGGHLVAFGGTRTYHRMAVAIEDAGFEVRDMIAWHYGSGFPKSHDISKAIDKAAGAERDRYPRAAFGGTFSDDNCSTYGTAISNDPATDAAREWEGWGTALKPATEPICLARKPLSEKSIAANVLKWGTGALNIDGCRIESGADYHELTQGGDHFSVGSDAKTRGTTFQPAQGRWPANLCHDGSDEVVAGFPETSSGELKPWHNAKASENRCMSSGNQEGRIKGEFGGDSGSAARFFYCAKAGKLDRLGSNHPTVKPVALMRWLVRLVTPPKGIVLDPFAGTGSTGIAALIEARDVVLIELRDEAAVDIQRRLDHIRGLGRMTALELAEQDLKKPERLAEARGHGLPLFGGGDE
jgi:DNA modification methylase